MEEIRRLCRDCGTQPALAGGARCGHCVYVRNNTIDPALRCDSCGAPRNRRSRLCPQCLSEGKRSTANTNRVHTGTALCPICKVRRYQISRGRNVCYRCAGKVVSSKAAPDDHTHEFNPAGQCSCGRRRSLTQAEIGERKQQREALIAAFGRRNWDKATSLGMDVVAYLNEFNATDGKCECCHNPPKNHLSTIGSRGEGLVGFVCEKCLRRYNTLYLSKDPDRFSKLSDHEVKMVWSFRKRRQPARSST